MWVGIFGVACDKKGESANASAGSETGPKSTRAERSPRDKALGPVGKLRNSLTEAKKMDPGAERDKALAAIAREAFELEAELAADAVRQLSPESPERLELMQQVASVLIAQNPEDAIAWADSMGGPEAVKQAREQVAIVLANTDPKRAISLISGTSFPKLEPGGTPVQILQAWTSQSPGEASSWVLRFPPGESRDLGMKALTGQWIQSDAKAATEWISSLPNDSVRGEAIQAMAKALIEFPEPIRVSFMQPIDESFRGDLESRIAALEPKPEPEPEPEPMPEPEPESDEDGGP